MEKIRATTKELKQAVQKIPQIAKGEGWVLTFDKDEGTLFYSPQEIPGDTELFQVTDEYALYLDKNKKPRGVTVEYYAHNFIKHHPEFVGITKKVFGGNKKEKIKTVTTTKGKKGDDALLFRALLERTLITETTVGTQHK